MWMFSDSGSNWEFPEGEQDCDTMDLESIDNERREIVRVWHSDVLTETLSAHSGHVVTLRERYPLGAARDVNVFFDTFQQEEFIKKKAKEMEK
jgi:hypothetical protein